MGLVPSAFANQFVRLDYNLELTNRGRDTAFIELFDDRPLTRDNFMAYVNAGRYDNMFMHRLVKDFVIQGGGFKPVFLSEPAPLNISIDPTALVDLDGNSGTANPTVNNEYTNLPKRSNLKGTLAMAKVGPPNGQPPNPTSINSATNQWFVNLKDNGEPSPNGLDYQNGGFTVFAEVRGDGIDLFDAFNSLTTRNLNPDLNNDLARDNQYPYSAVPDLATSATTFDLVIVEDAERIDYYGGTGSSTTLTIPVGGYTISTRDVFIDTGAVLSGSGPLTIGAGRTLGVRQGISLNRSVINQGTFAPGLKNAALSVTSYQQTANGTLAIDIGGTTVDTKYDRITANTTAQLAGKLEVDLINSFNPLPGNGFNVVAANAVTGTFSEIDLPDLDRFIWTVTQNAAGVILRVIAGDYNNNGTVDAADYTVWRSLLGSSDPTPYHTADGNGDKVINMADFDVWKGNFGKSDLAYTGAGGAGAAAVPEPGTCALGVFAMLTLPLVARRRPARLA